MRPLPCTHASNAYNTCTAKKRTLDQKIDDLATIVENGFAAVAAGIADVRIEMASD
jgi:hypothetical protein